MSTKEKVHDPYDFRTGELRHELKKFDRTIVYKGFEIKRNRNVPSGGYGYWEVPDLIYFTLGGAKVGFLTVSIIQSKEAIDRYMEYHNQMKKILYRN